MSHFFTNFAADLPNTIVADIIRRAEHGIKDNYPKRN